MLVVITGSTKGIGFSLAKKFVENGDDVVVSSSNPQNVKLAVENLRSIQKGKVEGFTCNVIDFAGMENMAAFAIDHFGQIDMWINNAGIAGGYYGPLLEFPSNMISPVIQTNVVGTLYGCKIAVSKMREKGPKKTKHIFNMAGYGSDGRLGPNLLTYGTSKCTIPYISKSLEKELIDTNIGIHIISPGMMITDLIVPQVTPENRKIMNILAETPETVVNTLFEKIRNVTGSGKYIHFLSKPKIMWRFMTVNKRKDRFFDQDGKLKAEYVNII